MTPLAIEVAAPHIRAWQQGTGGVSYVHERSANKPGPDVLVTALIHGNEYSGAIVIGELLASGWQPNCGRVTFAFCNVAAFERFNAQAPDASRFVDEDLNRVWSMARLASSDRSVELDRARQIRPFVERATHLLDLHSMHERAPPLLVAGTLPRNIAFAQSLGTASQVVIDSGHADGVRMRDYGLFGDLSASRIALLLEAGQHWERSSVQASRNVLMRFLLRAGVCEQGDVPPGWLLPDAAPPPPLEVTHRVVARSMEFEFTEDFCGGETIRRAGTPIAHDAGVPVLTPYDNCVLVMPSVRQLRPGVTTVRLGRLTEAHAS